MLTKVSFIFKRLCIQFNGWILAILWMLGLIFGIRFGCSNSQFVSEFLPKLSVQRSSLLLDLVCCAAPLGIVYVTSKIRIPFFVLTAGFIKAFVFGFSASAVCYAYGSAGWLVCLLLLFSGIMLMVPVLWLYLHSVTQQGSVSRFCILFYCIFSVLVLLFNHFAISPFLSALFMSL